jgi:hypothetical protein
MAHAAVLLTLEYVSIVRRSADWVHKGYEPIRGCALHQTWSALQREMTSGKQPYGREKVGEESNTPLGAACASVVMESASSRTISLYGGGVFGPVWLETATCRQRGRLLG